MKRFCSEFWRRFGAMFLVAGVLIGAVNAETLVDVVVTVIIFLLLALWVIMRVRRNRAIKTAPR